MDEWAARCPVRNFESFLIEQNIITASEIGDFATAIDREIEEAFEFAQASPLPDKDDVLEYLYQ